MIFYLERGFKMSTIQIRPVSDLRNNFTDIEKIVQGGNPVYLTKNGYGTMVVMSIDSYSELINPEERIMDEADQAAASTDIRLTSDQVFGASKRHSQF